MTNCMVLIEERQGGVLSAYCIPGAADPETLSQTIAEALHHDERCRSSREIEAIVRTLAAQYGWSCASPDALPFANWRIVLRSTEVEPDIAVRDRQGRDVRRGCPACLRE